MSRGRREDRVRAAPAVSCAKANKKRTRAYRFSGGNPAFPARWFTAYSALSLVTGLSCHHRRRDTSRQLDASVGAPGPHGFAVRRPRRSSFATPASTASHRAFVTIASRPSHRVRRGELVRVICPSGCFVAARVQDCTCAQREAATQGGSAVSRKHHCHGGGARAADYAFC